MTTEVAAEGEEDKEDVLAVGWLHVSIGRLEMNATASPLWRGISGRPFLVQSPIRFLAVIPSYT